MWPVESWESLVVLMVGAGGRGEWRHNAGARHHSVPLRLRRYVQYVAPSSMRIVTIGPVVSMRLPHNNLYLADGPFKFHLELLSRCSRACARTEVTSNCIWSVYCIWGVLLKSSQTRAIVFGTVRYSIFMSFKFQVSLMAPR